MANIDQFHEWVETQSPMALREYTCAQAAWIEQAKRIAELEALDTKQPKQPKYLYAYKVNAKIVELYDELQMGWDGKMLLGKIKLKVNDD